MNDTINNQTGATLTRLTLGSLLLAHGLMKVFIFTVPGTVGFFQSLGLPAIAAYATIFGELAGGTAIILGLYTRLAAFLSVPILLGALWAHSGNGWVFSNAGGGWEFPAFLVAIAISVGIQGSGAYALDKLSLVKRLTPKFLTA